MRTYDYEWNVKEDIKTALLDNYTKDELFTMSYSESMKERAYDDLWIDDAVTGNASGSYWFNTYKAEEALCHNMDLLQEALCEFGCGIEYLEKGAEACDVTIRCYLLGQLMILFIEREQGKQKNAQLMIIAYFLYKPYSTDDRRFFITRGIL